MQKALPALRKLGAQVMAVSPEKPDFSMPLIERAALEFEVPSDLGKVLARQVGISCPLEGELKGISAETFGVDLPKFNGDSCWEIPIPATAVIDPPGAIRLAFVDPEFRNRLDPEEIFKVLGRPTLAA